MNTPTNKKRETLCLSFFVGLVDSLTLTCHFAVGERNGSKSCYPHQKKAHICLPSQMCAFFNEIRLRRNKSTYSG